MMYNLVWRSPEKIDSRDKGIFLRSSQNVKFKEEKLNSEVYVKSPFARESALWKQLPSTIQKAENKEEFNRLLTDTFLETLL